MSTAAPATPEAVQTPSGMLTRMIDLAPSSVNAEARTAELVWGFGADVQRRDYTGPWIERLSMDPAHVDLTRLNAGGALLNSHQVYDVHAVLGAVVQGTARTDGTRGVATVKFSSRPEVAGIFDDVAAGIIRNVSVGYSVQAWKEEEDPKTRVRIRTAIRWTPLEISLVTVPADPGARIRSEEGHMSGSTIITTDPAPAPVQNRAEVNAGIRSIAATAGLDQRWIDSQIDAGATLEAARAAAFDAMRARVTPPVRSEAPNVQILTDHGDPSVLRARMAEAISCRFTGRAPSDSARPYMGRSILDMSAELMRARGAAINPFDRNGIVETLLSRTGAHTTADFPLLMADAANKVLQPAYQAAAPTYRQWAARRSFNDFKDHRFLRLGDFPAMRRIGGEGGELKYGTISENRTTTRPDEFAAGLAISRRALINDDLGALGEFSSMIAIRAAADENRLVYAVIADDGPMLEDGVPLYATSRGNRAASGTAIDAESIGAAVEAMRLVKSLDGILLNMSPRYLVVGPKGELPGRRVLAAIQPTRADDVNPWAGTMELVVDANVTGYRWHLFADPAIYPTVAYGYVAGNEGPRILTEIDFDTQALKVRGGIDFGTGPIDSRGTYLNPGAAPSGD